jgi:hypothetical protein
MGGIKDEMGFVNGLVGAIDVVAARRLQVYDAAEPSRERST